MSSCDSKQRIESGCCEFYISCESYFEAESFQLNRPKWRKTKQRPFGVWRTDFPLAGTPNARSSEYFRRPRTPWGEAKWANLIDWVCVITAPCWQIISKQEMPLYCLLIHIQTGSGWSFCCNIPNAFDFWPTTSYFFFSISSLWDTFVNVWTLYSKL